MPCACPTCLHHAEVLGLGKKSLTKIAIHKAFRAEAKLWHPDRFENNPAQRAEAEEHFKLIQVAYRELWEHCENPVQNSSEEVPADPVAPTAGPADHTAYQTTVTAPPLVAGGHGVEVLRCRQVVGAARQEGLDGLLGLW